MGKFSVGTVGLVAVIGLSGCSTVSDALYGVGLAQDASSMASGCSGITLANYNAVKPGMTINQVNKLLDCNGVEGVNVTNAQQGNVISYNYQGQGSRAMGVVTTNGKVSSKSKAGF